MGNKISCYVPEDGITICAWIIYSDFWDFRKLALEEFQQHLLLYKQGEEEETIVGFDVDYHEQNSVTFLKLYSQELCLVILLDDKDKNDDITSLKEIFLSKHLVFAGVHIKEVLKILQKSFGLRIRNALDLGELAAKQLQKPYLSAYGVRLLASEVLSKPLDSRKPLVITDEDNPDDFCSSIGYEIDRAISVVYVTYKIAKRLLPSSRASFLCDANVWFKKEEFFIAGVLIVILAAIYGFIGLWN